MTQLAGAAAPERPPAAGVRDPRVAPIDDVDKRHEAAVLLAQFRNDAAAHAERVGYEIDDETHQVTVPNMHDTNGPRTSFLVSNLLHTFHKITPGDLKRQQGMFALHNIEEFLGSVCGTPQELQRILDYQAKDFKKDPTGCNGAIPLILSDLQATAGVSAALSIHNFEVNNVLLRELESMKETLGHLVNLVELSERAGSSEGGRRVSGNFGALPDERVCLEGLLKTFSAIFSPKTFTMNRKRGPASAVFGGTNDVVRLVGLWSPARTKKISLICWTGPWAPGRGSIIGLRTCGRKTSHSTPGSRMRRS